MSAETGRHDYEPCDYTSIEEVKAPVESESPDAAYNPDVHELRRRITWLIGLVTGLEDEQLRLQELLGDLAERLSVRDDVWHEDEHGLIENAGDVGGDDQVGDACSRRFWTLARQNGLYEVVEAYAYPVEVPGGSYGVRTQWSYTICTDRRRPGDSEQWSEMADVEAEIQPWPSIAGATAGAIDHLRSLTPGAFGEAADNILAHRTQRGRPAAEPDQPLIGHSGVPLPPYLQRGGPGWRAIASRVGRGSLSRGDQLLVDGLCIDLAQALRPHLRG